MGYPSATHERPMSHARLMDKPRATHGLPTGYPWTTHKKPMDYLSAASGLLLPPRE